MVLVIARPKDIGHFNQQERQQINSVDISPDNKRLATSGADYSIKIWDLTAIIKRQEKNTDENENQNENGAPDGGKEEDVLLCTMQDQQHIVQVLRWSEDGFFLASGDALSVKLWVKLDGAKVSGNLLFDGNIDNKENWKCICTFQGHTLDISGLAWSPDCGLLASSSVDSTIRVWQVKDSYRSREIDMIESEPRVVLRGHEGWVKDVSWDPVGRYLASVGDDRAVVITRCSDWRVEARIEEPFRKSAETTMRRQLSWSPDGVFLCVSHAYDDPRHVAYMVERNKWRDYENAVRLVGHSAPISLTAFSPTIYARSGNFSTVVAIACRKSTLSIWTPGRNRPVVICRNLFKKQMLDMRWTHDGHYLIACSIDGHIACIKCTDFDQHPSIGEPIDRSAKEKLIRDNYGDEDMRKSEPAVLETRLQVNLEAMEKQKDQNVVIETSFARATTLSSSSSSAASSSSSSSSLGTSTNPNILMPRRSKVGGPGAENGPVNMLTPRKRPSNDTIHQSPKSIGSPQILRGGNNSSSSSNNNNSKNNACETLIIARPNDPRKRPALLSRSKCPRIFEKFIENAKDDGQNGKIPDAYSIKVTCLVKKGDLVKSARQYESIVVLMKSGSVQWQTTINGRVSNAAGTEGFCAVGTKAGELYLFGSHAGQLLLPPLQFSSPFAGFLCGGDNYLGVVTVDGYLRVYDIASLSVVIADTMIDPLLLNAHPNKAVKLRSGMSLTERIKAYLHEKEGDHDGAEDDSSSDEDDEVSTRANRQSRNKKNRPKTRETVDMCITKFGKPILILVRSPTSIHEEEDGGNAGRKNRGGEDDEANDLNTYGNEFGQICAGYTYVHRLRAWVKVADANQYLRSDFYSTLSISDTTVEEQILENVQLAVSLAGKFCGVENASAKARTLFEAGRDKNISRLHLESMLSSSLILGSRKEYCSWLVMYVERLVEEGDEKRLRALCNWLVPPQPVKEQDNQLISMIRQELQGTALFPSAKAISSNRDDDIIPDKPKFLRTRVLPLIARNRQLQKLVVEYDSILQQIGSEPMSIEVDNNNNNKSNKRPRHDHHHLIEERLTKK